MHIRRKMMVAVMLAISVAISAPAFASESDLILGELKRDDWQVRLLNAAALEKMRSQPSTEALIELLGDRGLNWRIQIRGIQLLGQMHTPPARAALLRLFSDLTFHQECPALKSNLALALGNFSGPEVVDALTGGLNDPEVLVREASIISLGRIGDTSAVPYLIAQLRDSRFTIKASAIRSLGLLKDATAVSALEKIADTDGEPLLRREAVLALSMIQRGGVI